MKKISVVIPVYNVEEYLRKCLDSVFNQTYKNFEVITINDGSTDQSLEILKEYEKKYENLIVIDQKNSGQGHARNVGIKKAQGDYITFLDSDDYIDHAMLEDFAREVEEDDYDIVIGDIWKVYKDHTDYFSQYHLFSNKANISFMLSHPGPVCRLYKKELFLKNNIFFKEGVYYEDLATIPLLGIYAKKIKHIERAYYYYLIHQNSTMKQVVYNPKIDGIFSILESLEEEFKYRSGKTYDKELEYLYIEHLLYSAYLRYLDYTNCKKQRNDICNLIHQKYSNYHQNIYYQNKSKKFKIVCFLAYHKCDFLLKLLKKISRK